MRSPRILIPTRRDVRNELPIQFIHRAHADALLSCGAIPIPVPSLECLAGDADEILALGDGLLLVEGGDIAPGRSPVPEAFVARLQELDAERDALEFALAERAIERGVPTLGTCRGAQVLNLVAGGTLHTHLPHDLGTDVVHVDGARYDSLRHPVDLAAGSRLRQIYGGDARISVTSVHHQGVRRLGSGFVEAGRSPDGLIEAFHAPDHPFLLAVQHHPERQFDEHPGHLGLYRALVEAARDTMA